VLGVLAATGASLLALGHGGDVSARTVSLDDVAAWLLSPAVGQAQLVDGDSAQVVTSVKLGSGVTAGAQSGADEFVADAAGGVRRIDGAGYQVSAPARLGRDGDTLTVYPSRDTLFAVDRTTGLVLAADPRTLAVRSRYTLSTRVPASGIVPDDAHGLWAIDGATGDLERVGPAGLTIQRRAVSATRSQLVSVAGRPVAVDLAARRASWLGPRGTTGAGTCVATDAADDTVSVIGSPTAPRLYVISGRRGLLQVSDLATGRCGDGIDLGVSGHRLGQPQEARGRVFVPDFTTGQVIVVDVAGARVIARPAVVAPATPFELRGQGPVVFFNVPTSSVAGVVSLDGAAQPVQKYDPAKASPAPGGVTGTDGQGNASTGSAGQGQQAHPPTPTPTTLGPRTQPSKSPSRQQLTQPQQEQLPQQEQQQPEQQQNQTRQLPLSQPGTTSAAGAQIEISAPQATAGASLTLRAVVVGASGQASTSRVTSATWSFGDATTGSGVQVTHAWTTPGQFRVAATMTLSDGSTATPAVTLSVISQAPPKAALTVSSAAGNAPLVLTADASGSKAGAAPISTYAFDFGDGTTSVPAAAKTASHRYANAGSYHLTVTVTDTAGHSDATTTTIDVTAPAASKGPKATLGVFRQYELTYNVTFDGTPGDAPIVRYELDSGMGTGSQIYTQPPPDVHFLYPHSGFYTATLKVTDQAGLTDTATVNVDASQIVRPELTVSPASGPAPLAVVADASKSTISGTLPNGTGSLTYRFDFGDGTSTGTQTSPTAPHTYSAAGSYTVTVTVVSSESGVIERSATASVTTSAGAVPGVVRNISFTYEEYESPPAPYLTIAWDPPTEGAAQVTGYTLTVSYQGRSVTHTPTATSWRFDPRAPAPEFVPPTGSTVTVWANSASGKGQSTTVTIPSDTPIHYSGFPSQTPTSPSPT
jgi:PKD repeat protein